MKYGEDIGRMVGAGRDRRSRPYPEPQDKAVVSKMALDFTNQTVNCLAARERPRRACATTC